MILNHLEEVDYSCVSAWLNDPEDMLKVCGGAFEYPLSKHKFIEYFVETPKVSGNRLCHKAVINGVAVGMCSFTRIDWRNDYGHIGLVTTDPSVRGQGIGKQMVHLLLDQGFSQHGFHRIDLVVVEGNDAAYRFYIDRCGFRDEGLMRGMIKTPNGYLGHRMLSILKTEWSGANG